MKRLWNPVIYNLFGGCERPRPAGYYNTLAAIHSKADALMPAQTIIQLKAASASARADVLAPLMYAAPERSYVIAQLGQSLDGRIATPTGESRWINRDCALDHVHRLRANVDAVVIGVGTALADDPLLTVRRVPGRHPARVVIDPAGRLGPEAKVFAADGVRRLIVAGQDVARAPGVETIIVEREGALLSPAQIVEALFKLGLKKILIEGGATTVSAFIDAGAVDRLHVLVAPVILGSGTTGLSLKAIAGLSEARRPLTTVHVLDDGDVLFDCDLRAEN
jgi:diaminohydroxyphosphoribosylaminopyrimidine deaminase / 5-amino-6-(5-phosphoribosylamino)uracil reductase